MKRHNGWKTASMVAATLAITALAGTSIAPSRQRRARRRCLGPRRPPTRARPRRPGSQPPDGGTGNRAGTAIRAGEAFEIAVLAGLCRPTGRQGSDRPRSRRRHGNGHGDRRRHEQRQRGDERRITTAVSQGGRRHRRAFGTPQEFGDGLADAAEAGIPVFGLDTGGVVEGILVNVTTDNRFLGEQSAQAIIDEIGEGAGTDDPLRPVRAGAPAPRRQGPVRGEWASRSSSTSKATPRTHRLRQRRRRRPRQVPRGRAGRNLGRMGCARSGRLPGHGRRRPHGGPRDRRRRAGVRHRRGRQGRQLDRHGAPGLAGDLGHGARPHRRTLCWSGPAEEVVFIRRSSSPPRTPVPDPLAGTP